MYHYLDHVVATLVVFAMVILLERIIHRAEPEHTLIELFLVAIANAISVPLTIAAITITYMLLVMCKQPNAISRASYWPVEIVRLFTRHKTNKYPPI